MKKYLCLVLFSLCLISVQAQTVIRGKIVDKKGVPVPGAKVSVKGGVESTLSEFDGSYYLIVGDDSKKVADLLKGGNTAINKFAFYIMGEGLEKKSEDLSEEVAKQVAAAQK